MLDIKEKEKLFDGVFARNQNRPQEWGFMAWTLRTGADVLFVAHKDSWEPNGEPINPENEHLDSPASMLYGCAMENMIKGYLIKIHGGFEPACAANKAAWHKHEISKLAEATGLPLTHEQKLLLGSLEAFIRWAGRYPMSMKRDQFTVPKQYRSGDHITPNEIRRDGIEILEPFYKKLNEAIFESYRNDADLASI